MSLKLKAAFIRCPFWRGDILVILSMLSIFERSWSKSLPPTNPKTMAIMITMMRVMRWRWWCNLCAHQHHISSLALWLSSSSLVGVKLSTGATSTAHRGASIISPGGLRRNLVSFTLLPRRSTISPDCTSRSSPQKGPFEHALPSGNLLRFTQTSPLENLSVVRSVQLILSSFTGKDWI